MTSRIIGAAIEVHRRLGPGLLESVYEACLCREMEIRQIGYQRQVSLDVEYKGVRMKAAYRLDLIVEDSVVVEIKSTASIEPVHRAQVLTYLRLSGCRLGIILNFNVPVLPKGILRLAL